MEKTPRKDFHLHELASIFCIKLIKSECLHISGRVFKMTSLIFHHGDKKWPYFSYFEQKVEKISFHKDDQKRRKNRSTCLE